MVSAVEHRGHSDRRSISPVRRSPSRGGRRSPDQLRSPSPHAKRLRRMQDERVAGKGEDREHVRRSMGEGERGEKEGNGPSRSLSPRSKRLLRAQAEKSRDDDHGRYMGREGRDKRGHGEDEEGRDTLSERRSKKDKSDGGSSRPSRRDRSVSPVPDRRSKHSSRSPSRTSRGGGREESSRPRGTEHSRDGELDSVAMMKAAEESLEAKEKDKKKPSFELSGKLAEETNRVREPLYVHRQSCYLFGRERRVADIPTDHPSCSKQHAVIQYRLVDKEEPDGLLSKQVRPYVMDLGSTNGTFVNDNRIEPQRYYELFEKDTIRFGNSSREYVILHENSAE